MYRQEFTEECEIQIKKLTRKNGELGNALENKVEKILQNPNRFNTLSNVLAGKRRVHIMGCFVLIYEIDEARQTVVFRRFGHHDEVYL